MENKELIKSLAECSAPDELMKVLEENNIVLAEGLTPEKAFDPIKGNSEDELDDETLEDVSGGFLPTKTKEEVDKKRSEKKGK